MLTSLGRTRIVSLGDAERRDFSRVCIPLGVSIEQLTGEAFDISAPDLLAVLVTVDSREPQKTRGQLLRLIAENAFEYGVLLIVASTELAQAVTLQADVIQAANSGARSRMLRPKLPDFVAIGLTTQELASPNDERESIFANELARVLRDHETEVAADSDLEILGGGDADFWEQDSILLRRAFKGFTKIELKEEPGGRSADCVVWQVTAWKGQSVLEPFVAKAALRQDLEHEFYTYRDLVRDYVPFPFRAPLLESRFVRGGSRAVLVSAFVTRAQRFDQYLRHTTHPNVPVATLFHAALGNWRKGATLEQEISVGRFYVEQQEQATADSDDRIRPLLPNPTTLTQAFEFCQTRRLPCRSPGELWDILRNLPTANRYVSRVHGDLNVRNVFVRWNSSDTILIDFFHSGIIEFLARDPAKLETSIALTCSGQRRGMLPRKCLLELYRMPLLPLRSQGRSDARIEAIRQIRREAGGEGISNHEYGVLISCHLLRFAGHSPDASLAPRRGLSYSLATAVIERLNEYL